MTGFSARRQWRDAAVWIFAIALAAVPLDWASAKTSIKANGKERQCLATAIYFEARGEPVEGQKAVAQVILNRVRDDAFPDTICGVVYQNHTMRNRCQFSFACDGTHDNPSDKRAWTKAQAMAEKALGTTLPVADIGNATHFHAVTVKPRWSSRMRRKKKIGRHIFYSA